MPPRFAYWTILIDNKPTAFRARDQQELLPTLAQLKRKNEHVELKWFEQGQLWDSPEAQHAAGRRPGAPPEKRGGDWRPGGQHKDPRARFDKEAQRRKKREQRAEWNASRPADVVRRDRDKLGPPPDSESRDRPLPPRGDRPWQQRPPRDDRPPEDWPWQTKPTGPRAERKPWQGERGGPPRGDRKPWDKPGGGPPRGERQAVGKTRRRSTARRSAARRAQTVAERQRCSAERRSAPRRSQAMAETGGRPTARRSAVARQAVGSTTRRDARLRCRSALSGRTSRRR